MSADVSLPEPPAGSEWLALGTLLALVVAAVFAAYLGGFKAGATASGAVVTAPGPPSWATTGLVAAAVGAVVFPVAEIAVKLIAGSADDGPDGQAEPESAQEGD